VFYGARARPQVAIAMDELRSTWSPRGNHVGQQQSGFLGDQRRSAGLLLTVASGQHAAALLGEEGDLTFCVALLRDLVSADDDEVNYNRDIIYGESV
jgi:hypothetical protein